jgi:hypothetical protein
MKQEDKELLFKDICARLPYKVKVSYYDNENERQECDVVDSIYEDTQEIGVGQWCLKMDKIKPYLFPLSSMTEEQKEDLLLTIVGKEGLKLFSVTKDGIISNDKAEQSFENFSLNIINFSNENTENKPIITFALKILTKNLKILFCLTDKIVKIIKLASKNNAISSCIS